MFSVRELGKKMLFFVTSLKDRWVHQRHGTSTSEELREREIALRMLVVRARTFAAIRDEIATLRRSKATHSSWDRSRYALLLLRRGPALNAYNAACIRVEALGIDSHRYLDAHLGRRNGSLPPAVPQHSS